MGSGLVTAMSYPAVAWAGLAVMALGSAIVLAAQLQMGASWRIGLDPEPTGLVTSGLFAWSRNPTLLGVMVVSSAFLVVPTVMTAAVLAAAWIAFSIQIRIKEEHLLRMHGKAYDRNRASAPRWIGARANPNVVPASRGHPVDHG